MHKGRETKVKLMRTRITSYRHGLHALNREGGKRVGGRERGREGGRERGGRGERRERSMRDDEGENGTHLVSPIGASLILFSFKYSPW
jgi:hypothetical protein